MKITFIISISLFCQIGFAQIPDSLRINEGDTLLSPPIEAHILELYLQADQFLMEEQYDKATEIYTRLMSSDTPTRCAKLVERYKEIEQYLKSKGE